MDTHNIQKGRQEYGAPSENDPYAWATSAVIYANPDWAGDRHKDDLESNGGRWFPRGEGKAPPWGKGPFAEGARGAILRDDLAENAVPEILREFGWTQDGFNELIRRAKQTGSARRRRKAKPAWLKMEKAKKPKENPNLLEEQEELSEDDKRYQQYLQEASAAWQGGGSDIGSGGYSWDLPEMSGENVKRYFEDDKEGSKRAYKPYQGLVKDMDLKKISPSLARLMAAAAGWSMSDDVVRSGGGSPRGERTAAEESEWREAIRRQERREEEDRRRQEERRTAADRRRHERSMRRAMRTRKALDDFPEFGKIQNFWSEKTDDYHRKRPVKNGAIAKTVDTLVNLIKDHAPVPPRQGLVWDAVKHKWVRPENHGHSVSEVQGGKRIRGHGTGVHERAVGGHGRGPVRRQQEGRRFRGVADSGTARPHEAPHPAQRYLSSKGAASPKLQRRKRVKRFK